ncbi:Hypothetical protein GbCGDNIH3_8100 [Granulibacter bethesdensis]|uniref:Uncharacterized protein n=1 Tax=Granulibacter bethesdensis TaxID=364410 RepID=A0AAN1AM71_9PROT|nr:Hypothetical protein GbCGDNIH3_8100 [Granulibacter bethesdensis]APH58473.1 Hypothetical protein GbCGDNIH7_7008 [Granulibacter bethesdensis]
MVCMGAVVTLLLLLKTRLKKFYPDKQLSGAGRPAPERLHNNISFSKQAFLSVPMRFLYRQ